MRIKEAIVGGAISVAALGGSVLFFAEAFESSKELAVMEACNIPDNRQRDVCSNVLVTEDAITHVDQVYDGQSVGGWSLGIIGGVGVLASVAVALVPREYYPS